MRVTFVKTPGQKDRIFYIVRDDAQGPKGALTFEWDRQTPAKRL